MKLFPFEHIIYKTQLSEMEVKERISNFIEPKKFRFIISKPLEKKYEGELYGQNFEISRIGKGRNLFLPQIMGVILKDDLETKIEVKIKSYWSVKIFGIIWCLSLLLIPILTLVNVKDFDLAAFLVPIFLVLFMVGRIYFGFKTESEKSKLDLKNLFEAEMTELKD